MKTVQQISAEYGIIFNPDTNYVSLPDWNTVLQIPEFQRLNERTSTTRWHQERNMFTHTQLVCREMQRIISESHYTPEIQYILMLAALMHDVGKCDCTNTPDGKLLSEGHPLISDKICRRLLWNLDIDTREKICELVRWHDLHCRTSISDRKLAKKVNQLSQWLFINIHLLYNLFRADDYGSIKDISMYGSSKLISSRIESVENRYQFHTTAGLPKDFGRFTVYVMCGLPGSGKSTWIKQNNVSYLPVVSRDIIREELGMTQPGVKFVGTAEQEDTVSEISDTRVEELCKRQQSFVYDNMNTREKYRRSLLNKISKYHPTVVYVYLEVKDLEILKMRRPEIVSAGGENVFDNMLSKMEFPRPEEYDRLTVLED